MTETKYGSANFSIIQADITTLDVDAIVNAANSRLLAGGGVCGAIHRAAGPQLEAECLRLYPQGIKPGQAVITKGFNAKSKFVIHAVAPISSGTGWGDIDTLLSAYTSAILVADDAGVETLAIPSLGTGTYGWDVHLVAKPVISAAILPALSKVKNLKQVILCCFSDDDLATYRAALPLDNVL